MAFQWSKRFIYDFVGYPHPYFVWYLKIHYRKTPPKNNMDILRELSATCARIIGRLV